MGVGIILPAFGDALTGYYISARDIPGYLVLVAVGAVSLVTGVWLTISAFRRPISN
jgi:hypothetical protein